MAGRAFCADQFHVLLKESVAREQESHVVGLGAAGGEGSVRRGGQSGLAHNQRTNFCSMMVAIGA